jgi:divalent metal cation (Fe/Co/Zn/Cd) transporter
MTEGFVQRQSRFSPDTGRRVQHLQLFTLAWMSVEAIVALWAAWQARSVALAAFGGDSLVEWASAAVVFGRFRRGGLLSERVAEWITGSLLLGLAASVMVGSGLSLLGTHEPQPSPLGIILLALAAVIMPWLARQKRALAAVTGSAALNADATEAALCGYQAWIALGGLILNAWRTLPWADSVAALALVPLIAREGWSTIREARLCDDGT